MAIRSKKIVIIIFLVLINLMRPGYAETESKYQLKLESSAKTLVSRNPNTRPGEIQAVNKSMIAEIGTIGASGVALIYKRDDQKDGSFEMWFSLNRESINILQNFEIGDIVRADYKEASDGSARILRSVSLLERQEKAEEVKKSDEKAEDKKSAV